MLKPFHIHLTDEIITDLRSRLAATRWPDEIDNSNWSWGTNMPKRK